MHGVHGLPQMDYDKVGLSASSCPPTAQKLSVLLRARSLAAAKSPLTWNNGKPPAEGSASFEGHLGTPTQVIDMDTPLINLLANCWGVLMSACTLLERGISGRLNLA